MTKQELQQQCTWDDYTMAKLELEIPMLNTKTNILFDVDEGEGQTISDGMVISLNELLELTDFQLDQIKEYLFWFFNLCCEQTFYGDIEIDYKEDETDTEANKRHFGVNNKEDAFNKSKLEEVIITEYENRITQLYFYAPWEDEHGCEVEIKNGKVTMFAK